MRVVCTAGHVDHGKSALVEALTGTHPDRFAEERARGLTIDIGFAWTELADAGEPVTIAFVDLPGHERFIGNMLAGAGGVDLALLVVAADEGWMPQSAEHLAILDLLGVRHGLVAVTKIDLVDEETAAMAVELVRDELAGTTLGDARIVPVSTVDGRGLDALQAELHALITGAPSPPDAGRPRLWVDRSFSIAGAGTVVTGTLQGGRVRTGDALEVLPGGRQGRIRGLQQLGSKVDEAHPGTRVAINLAGVEVRDVPRGRALGTPGQWVGATTLDARLHTLGGTRVGRRGAWKVYAGSGQWTARLRPFGAERLQEGASADVRIVLEAPAPLVPGDRFVLRDSGRRATAGGGVVLDVDPPRRRPHGRDRVADLRAREAALEAGDRGRLLAQHVAERGSAERTRVAAAVGLDERDAAAAAAAHGLATIGNALVDPGALQAWGDAVLEALRAYHAASPVESAAPRDVAARALTGVGCPAPLVAAVLDGLVAAGRLAAEGPRLRDPAHRPTLDEAHTAARDTLLARLTSELFTPTRLEEAAREAGATSTLLLELQSQGELVRLAPDIAVPPATLRTAHERLHAAFEDEGPLTAARAKEVLGTSRRIALPLLEEMDRRRLTRRVGDRREVAPPAEG